MKRVTYLEASQTMGKVEDRGRGTSISLAVLVGSFASESSVYGDPSLEVLQGTTNYARLEQPHRVLMMAKYLLLGGVGWFSHRY